MTWYWSHQESRRWSLNAMYRAVGISKQAFHQYLGRRRSHHEEVLNLRKIIMQIREDHPTMCCRAMYYKINPLFNGQRPI